MFDWINQNIQAVAIDGFSGIPDDTEVPLEELLGWVTWRHYPDSVYRRVRAVGSLLMDCREQPALALLKEVSGAEESREVLWNHGRREEVPTLYSLITLGEWKGTITKRGDWGVSTYNGCVGLTGATRWSERRKAMIQGFKLRKLVALESGWQQMTPSSTKQAYLRCFENNLCPYPNR